MGSTPLRAFLGQRVFALETVTAIGEAFELVVARQGLRDRTDALTEMVANKIVAIAATGETRPQVLAGLALTAIRADDYRAAGAGRYQ